MIVAPVSLYGAVVSYGRVYAMIKGKVKGFDEKKGALLENGTYIKGDFYINTLLIDELFGYKFGELPYRGVKHQFKVLDQEYYFPKTGYQNTRFSYVYYPDAENPKTRIAEYKVMSGQKHSKTIISIAKPSKESKFWPFYSRESERLYRKYINHVSKIDNFMTVGRLGLYKYATMDITVRMCMRATESVEGWAKKNPEERMKVYEKIRGEAK